MMSNENELLIDLLKQFGFNKYQQLSKNETGEVYLVHRNEDRYILKLQKDIDKFEREVRALKILNSKKVQVPILTNSGVVSGKCSSGYFIQSLLEGETLSKMYSTFDKNEKLQLLYDAGKLVGNINTICTEYELRESGIWKFSYDGIKDYEKYNWFNLFKGKFNKWFEKINFVSAEEKIFIRESVEIIEKAIRYFDSGKRNGLLHRDFGFRNIIVDNGTIQGAIDFEYAAIGDIEYDLAKLIFNDIDFSMDNELRESFFAGWEDATKQKVQWNRLWLYLAIQGMGAIQWVDRQEDYIKRLDNQDYRVKGMNILYEACLKLKQMI